MRLGNQQISAAYLGSAQLTEIYLGASPVLGAGGAPADTTPPVFTSGDTATPIAENSGAGQTVYTAAATDDSLPVTYSLKATGDHAAFSINASTGAVTLTANPDYESKASYAFTVIATDAAGNASEQAVTLSITDVDEAAPTLVSAAVNGTSLVLTYTESLATPGPAASAFSVSGATTAAQTPSSAVVSGATVTLTLSTTAAYGQTITVSYAVTGANPIRDAAGNNAAALTAQAVTNNTWGIGSLFSSGEDGIWLDAGTMSTLYGDTSGVTPLTSLEQSIGRANDRSGRSRSAIQGTATARPALSARVNIITGSEDFSTYLLWQATVTPNDIAAPDGQTTADRVTSTVTAGSSYIRTTINFDVGIYVYSCYIKAGTTTYAALRINDSSAIPEVRFNLSAVTSDVVSGSALSHGISDVGGGWRRCWVVASVTSVVTGWCGVYVYSELGYRSYASSGESVYLWGADLRVQRPSAAYPEYQRVTAATDYAATGFPVFARFDGLDDKLVATFGAPLGGSCTVAYAVPGVGATVMSGQTVGATHDITQTFAQYVVVNRALTMDESAKVTATLNLAAGI